MDIYFSYNWTCDKKIQLKEEAVRRQRQKTPIIFDDENEGDAARHDVTEDRKTQSLSIVRRQAGCGDIGGGIHRRREQVGCISRLVSRKTDAGPKTWPAIAARFAVARAILS